MFGMKSKLFLLMLLLGVGNISFSSGGKEQNKDYPYVNNDTTINELLENRAFEGFGQFILPMNMSFNENLKLSSINRLLPYHSNINSETTISSINFMIDEVKNGRKIFYDFYTEKEKTLDPNKRNTGLFFFRGKKNAPFAVISPGGGFSYVGSIHEGFPYAIELSKKGYNAFVLQYRVGNGYNAVEDLASALSFIFDNAEKLEVSTKDYSLWGSSAGARMAAAIGSYGTFEFGGKNLPKPVSVIMAYTGQSDYTKNDPPTFAVVGDRDGIANPSVVERRINNLKKIGIDAEFHKYKNIGHGFGLGTGTNAEGWLDEALLFWEKHITYKNY